MTSLVDLSTPLVSDLPALVVPGRSCGTCSLCCKVFAVSDFNKPRSVWCQHCAPDGGCAIHATRPSLCREFFCNWLLLENLGPEWKPERCHLVLQSIVYPGDHQCLAIHVDPDFPDSWRSPPFHQQIKQWSLKASERTTGPLYFVRLVIDLRNLIVLPDREIDLGNLAENESVHVERSVTAQGVKFVARKIPRRELALARV